MGAVFLTWALITLAGGILQQTLGPSLIRQANTRADRERAARIAAELETRIARRAALRHAATPIKPATRAWLGPRR